MKSYTIEARRWAAGELCRRALPGHSIDVVLHSEKTALRFGGRIVNIAHDPVPIPGFTERPASSSTEDTILVPGVPGVPGVPDGRNAGPVIRCDDRSAHTDLDLVSATFQLLTRMEEDETSERDAHGRFPASASKLVRAGCLHRPVVDEWALALEASLRTMLPGLPRQERTFRVHLSHDIDHAGSPVRARVLAKHVVRRRRLSLAFRDLLAWTGSICPTDGAAAVAIVEENRRRAMRSSVYWKFSGRGPLDSGYRLQSRPLRSLPGMLNGEDIEFGLHPGYETYRDSDALRREVERFVEFFGIPPRGGRQHYLRWDTSTWDLWEDFGFAYDATVGFADAPGFRAGTCIPYRPWSTRRRRELNLFEVPLIVMDAAILDGPVDELDQRVANARLLIDACQQVGGVFSMLWHNDRFIDDVDRLVYRRMLDELSGSASFTPDAQ